MGFFDLPHYSRTTKIVVSNLFGGTLLGAGSVYSYFIIAGMIALIGGLIVGFVFLPWTCMIMRYRIAWIAWLSLYVPTLAAAVAISYLSEPGASLMVTVASFVAMSILADHLLPEYRPPPTACPQCGYDLRGLDHECCPECGLPLASVRSSRRESSPGA